MPTPTPAPDAGTPLERLTASAMAFRTLAELHELSDLMTPAAVKAYAVASNNGRVMPGAYERGGQWAVDTIIERGLESHGRDWVRIHLNHFSGWPTETASAAVKDALSALGTHARRVGSTTGEFAATDRRGLNAMLDGIGAAALDSPLFRDEVAGWQMETLNKSTADLETERAALVATRLAGLPTPPTADVTISATDAASIGRSLIVESARVAARARALQEIHADSAIDHAAEAYLARGMDVRDATFATLADLRREEEIALDGLGPDAEAARAPDRTRFRQMLLFYTQGREDALVRPLTARRDHLLRTNPTAVCPGRALAVAAATGQFDVSCVRALSSEYGVPAASLDLQDPTTRSLLVEFVGRRDGERLTLSTSGLDTFARLARVQDAMALTAADLVPEPDAAASDEAYRAALSVGALMAATRDSGAERFHAVRSEVFGDWNQYHAYFEEVAALTDPASAERRLAALRHSPERDRDILVREAVLENRAAALARKSVQTWVSSAVVAGTPLDDALAATAASELQSAQTLLTGAASDGATAQVARRRAQAALFESRDIGEAVQARTGQWPQPGLSLMNRIGSAERYADMAPDVRARLWSRYYTGAYLTHRVTPATAYTPDGVRAVVHEVADSDVRNVLPRHVPLPGDDAAPLRVLASIQVDVARAADARAAGRRVAPYTTEYLRAATRTAVAAVVRAQPMKVVPDADADPVALEGKIADAGARMLGAGDDHAALRDAALAWHSATARADDLARADVLRVGIQGAQDFASNRGDDWIRPSEAAGFAVMAYAGPPRAEIAQDSRGTAAWARRREFVRGRDVLYTQDALDWQYASFLDPSAVSQRPAALREDRPIFGISEDWTPRPEVGFIRRGPVGWVPSLPTPSRGGVRR